jgi:hypothetical protein
MANPKPMPLVPELVSHRFSLWTRLGGRGAASFDASGRLLTLKLDRRYLRRGLDNSLLELTRDSGGPWPYAARRLDRCHDLCRLLLEQLQTLESVADTPRSRTLLRRAMEGLRDGYRSDSESFRRVVGPVPIVPPDNARSVVLRLTEGCAYNRCSFCSLYRDTAFRTRGPAEFAAHVDQVLDYFGEGAGMRPGVWIGDASALEAGTQGFAEALEILRRRVRIQDGPPGQRDLHLFKGEDPFVFEGVYAFSDVPRTARLDPEHGRRLARLGVRRLYMGVESGHAPLLRRLAKPHTPDQVREAVRRLHASGIAAGIILLVGAGGLEFARAHRQDSASLVGSLDLGPDDFVFLSPLDRDSRASGAPVAGEQVFGEQELAQEVRDFRAAVRAAADPRRLRIADYQLECFVY